MKKVNIVVGANYGDEGKGLVTRYLTLQAKSNNQSCLNVLYNGGAQRGHTIETLNTRAVTHHFGAGVLDGAATYCTSDFIVSPTAWQFDADTFANNSNIFVHPDCRVSTLYDAIINRTVEDARGDNRHGSVGVGMWETVNRYMAGKYALPVSDMMKLSDKELFNYFDILAREYVPQRLKEYGILTLPDEYRHFLASDNAKQDMVTELRRFTRCSIFTDHIPQYDSVIFEAGQGLALSASNCAAYPHVTVSNTGSNVPLRMIAKECDDIEIDYVSRAYFTRHGEGMFPTECSPSDIAANISDKTNRPNGYQGSLRYGKFDASELIERIYKDISDTGYIKPNIKLSLFLTHMNYAGYMDWKPTMKALDKIFDNIYVSSTLFAEDIQLVSKEKLRQWYA